MLEVSTSEKFESNWWENFHDPLLEKIIEKARVANNQLLSAEGKILEARAYRKIALAKLFPQIVADLNATKTFFSKNGPIFSIGEATGDPTDTTSSSTGIPFTIQSPQKQNLYNALVDASWELDLFGKTRRSVEAANAQIEATVYEKNDLLISIFAEIAINYMELRSFQRHLALSEEKIALLEKKQELFQEGFCRGLFNKLELDKVEIELLNEKALLPSYIAAINRDIYAISVLTGDAPEALYEELIVYQDLPTLPEQLATGIRSDLLKRRPDIRKAERLLAQATANIGVAVASFFPSVSLLADGGLQSLLLGNLFQWSSRTWAYGGDINLPIFQGGKLVGNLRATKAKTIQATYNYQQTILTAFQEAESALITYTQSLSTLKEIKASFEKESDITFLTKERYAKGLVSLISFLDSQKNLFDSEERYIDKQTASLLDLISLYKSLGGGWEKDME